MPTRFGQDAITPGPSLPNSPLLQGPRTISWDVSARTLPDAYERYVVGMADMYDVSDISLHDRQNFFNSTRTTMGRTGGVGEGKSVPQTLSRGPAMLRRSTVDGLNITINQTATAGEYDGHSRAAPPGALQFRDMERLSSTRLTTVDLMSVLTPRNMAPRVLLGPDMHGLVLVPTEPGVRLVTAHMRNLVDLSEGLAEAELDAALQALFLIIARIAGSAVPLSEADTVSLQKTVRRTAAEHIERDLQAAPLPLDIDAIAVSAGVSRATLYRAFDGEGGVKRYIQERRLHHARNALRQRRDKSESITTVAERYGFISPSHFSRLFRARYGYSPSEVEPPLVPSDIALSIATIRHDLLAEWLRTSALDLPPQ